MYFVLDVSNFLQCKDDLLQSFCHVFSVSSAFSQQIFGFWLLDQGLVTVRRFLIPSFGVIKKLSWYHITWVYEHMELFIPRIQWMSY